MTLSARIICIFILLDSFAWSQSMNIKWVTFQLNSWKAELGSESESRIRQLSGIRYAGESQRNDFQEELTIAGQGSVYHPNLLSYFINATVGLQQGNFDISGSSYPGTRNAGFVQNLNFQTQILSQKPLTVGAAIYRNSQLKEDSFFDNNKTSLERETVQVNWNNLSFPMTFNYSQSDQKEFLGIREIHETKDQANLGGSFGNRDSFNGNFRITKTDKQREEKTLGTKTFDNLNIQSSLHYPLAKGSKNKVSNSINLTRLNSIDSTLLFNTNTTFAYRITPAINSRSSVLSSHRVYNGNRSKNYQVKTDFSHRLFSSLQSEFGIEAIRFTDDAYQKRSFQYSAATTYRKNLRQGRLNIDLSLIPKWERVEADSGPLRHGQLLTPVSGFSPVWVQQIGIQPGSIEIYDELNEIQYEEQLDYDVLLTESFLQIQRVPGSAIPDSAVIQVYYIYEGEASYSTEHDVYGYGIKYSFQDFWGIEFGYTGTTSKYPTYATDSRQSIDPFHSHQWFLDLDYQPFNVNFDYEMSTSRITPFNLTSFSIDGLYGSFANQYLVGRFQYSRQNLIAQNDQINQAQFHLEYFRRLSRNIRIQFVWGYRNVEGSLNNLQENKLRATFQYTHRKLKAKIILSQLVTNLYEESDTSRKGVLQLSINS